jgi:signal transduction histidine kinase
MDKNDKRAIKLGLLANAVFFVLVFLVPRIVGLVWNLVLTVGGFVHKGYVDSIYRNAALDERNLIGQHMALFVLILAPVYLSMYLRRKRIEARLARSNELSHFDKIERIILTSAFATAVPIYLMLFVIFVVSLGTAQIAASFNQRLSVLAPAISDAEYKALKARWASMNGKADYDALVSAMDKRSAELGVKLPEVRKP